MGQAQPRGPKGWGQVEGHLVDDLGDPGQAGGPSLGVPYVWCTSSYDSAHTRHGDSSLALGGPVGGVVGGHQRRLAHPLGGGIAVRPVMTEVPPDSVGA